MTDLATRQDWIEKDKAEAATRAAKVQALTKRQEMALEAYALGMSYSSIAQVLGVKTASAAQKVVDAALQQRADLQDHQGVNKARARMLVQIELMLSRFMPLALQGDEKAAKVVGSYLDRTERLLGLGAPKKHEHHHEIDVQSIQQRQEGIVAKLQAFAGRTIEGEITE
jgi:hypothetical protein